MATKSYGYDFPHYQVHVPVTINCAAVAAETFAAKFVAFQACVVKSIRGVVTIVGDADADGYDLFNGTTSFASAVTGTTANAAIAVTMDAQTLAAGGYIAFKTKADGGTQAASFVLEVEPVPGADLTV